MTKEICSRRKFCALAGVGILGAAGISAAAPPPEAAPASTTAATVRALVAAGSIGAVTLGHSSIGACAGDVVAAHRSQLLFLMDALGAPTARGHHTATMSPATCGYAGMLTSVSLSDGARIEVVTSSSAVAGNGCVIRGRRGHITIEADRVSLFSDDGALTEVFRAETCWTVGAAPVEATRMTQHIMGDSFPQMEWFA